MSRRIVSAIGSVCVLAALLSVSLAQDAKEAKPSTKARGRLPAHYKDVVSEEQRTTIYSIQEKYGDQIRKLAEEMKALTAQRDKEIEAVLSADQKAKVDALKAEAAKKKAPAADKTEAKETTATTVKETEKTTAAKSPGK